MLFYKGVLVVVINSFLMIYLRINIENIGFWGVLGDVFEV